MLYVGSFYLYKEKESKSTHFIYFAEADDPKCAVEQFRVGIRKTTKQTDTGIYGEIYLHSIVEISKMPRGGAMAFLQEIDYRDPCSTLGNTGPLSFVISHDQS